MTTSGEGQNSHNIQNLSQGDRIGSFLGRQFEEKIVTISNICHKVVVRISDIYCMYSNLMDKRRCLSMF